MAPRRASVAAAACGVSLLLLAGCTIAPTYPRDQVVSGLLEILLEGGIPNAAVNFTDHTLSVQLTQKDMLVQNEGQVGMGPAFDKAVGDIVQALHRVILSSDADIRFYAVVVGDPAVPGLFVHLVRYIDDIRRANASMIGPEELFARTVIELQATEPPHAAAPPPVVPEIRFEEFLSWQTAKRIQQKLIQELEQPGQVQVGRCVGQFTDGEFAFTLNVNPSDNKKPLDDATLQRIFQTSTGVITQVLDSYRFKNFNAVRLIHPMTGRHMLLPKARLELLR